MRTATPAFIAIDALCLVATCLVTIQAFRNPKKLRTSLVIYAILSLPCCIVNTLAFEDIIADRWNSLAYLISTAITMTIRIYLVMDIGLRLQTRPGWFHGLAYTGMAFLIGSCICIVVQLGILGAHPEDQYPYRPVFITGVCLAIVSSMCAYLFAFLPLIRSIRASAYGIWFLTLETSWSTVYGTIYLWFFIVNTWEWYFDIMLLMDYAMRFILCLMNAWPPPQQVIDTLSSHLHGKSNKDHTSSQINIATVPQRLE
ncbi:hypothetical protein LRAMOSA02679 [Lichtheimia ramosa]|uniref:Integral membrane protein n=1 Tax=Lichtheimia ramosa TaxID=688394 RepID=A0A077WTN0_9FUNG|nr:hypothetical protein LRAMOSA02679 [Lichtheimia ramosa]